MSNESNKILSHTSDENSTCYAKGGSDESVSQYTALNSTSKDENSKEVSDSAESEHYLNLSTHGKENNTSLDLGGVQQKPITSSLYANKHLPLEANT